MARTTASLHMICPSVVPQGLATMYAECVERRDWFGAMHLASSENVAAVAEHIWPQLETAERVEVLAEAISSDLPSRHIDFLFRALDDVLSSGQRVFDSPAAADRFAHLPDRVTIYRGTVLAEEKDAFSSFGISWTLSRDVAIFFATKHHRFRNRESPPILLSATVWRDDIGGLLMERKEDEVIIPQWMIEEDCWEVEPLSVDQ